MIQKLIVSKSSKRIYQECLKVLYFDEFQQRRLLLSKACDGTFKWIWTNDRFVEWYDGGSKMLWIHWKPASAKSTMMKFIRQGLIHRPHPAGEKYIVVDFFYSVRGNTVEQEHIWMLRSILWQILAQCPYLWPDAVLQLFTLESRSKASDEPEKIANWFSSWLSDENLQWLLQSVSQCDSTRSAITIYVLVDAMDESELLNRRRIVMSLLELTTHQPKISDRPIIFKVLVASRPTLQPTLSVTKASG